MGQKTNEIRGRRQQTIRSESWKDLDFVLNSSATHHRIPSVDYDSAWIVNSGAGWTTSCGGIGFPEPHRFPTSKNEMVLVCLRQFGFWVIAHEDCRNREVISYERWFPTHYSAQLAWGLSARPKTNITLSQNQRHQASHQQNQPALLKPKAQEIKGINRRQGHPFWPSIPRIPSKSAVLQNHLIIKLLHNVSRSKISSSD